MSERQDTVIGCINTQVVNAREYLFSFQVTVLISVEDFVLPDALFLFFSKNNILWKITHFLCLRRYKDFL